MPLVLSAEQRSIEQVFSAPELFVVPAYQRPYSWEYDQCFQLYKDLTTAFEDGKKDYFIGNVIIAKSATERTNRYLVDGQQRLITMWLFLRIANLLYPEMKVLKKLTVVESREEGVDDELNICSKVFERGDGEALKRIYKYETSVDFDAYYKSCCNRNAVFIETRCNSRIEANAVWLYTWLVSFRGKDSVKCKEFIYYVLDQVYLLPIELTGDSVDEANNKALKIFETINNRGMNFEDADIFNAKLYDKAAANNEKDVFIRQWLEFRSATDELNMEVDDVFRYYSHIIRGKQRITSSETNLRELFVDSDYSPLITKTYSDVMFDLMRIIECLKYIEYKQNDLSESSKWIQIIKAYSNQYPTYAIVAYLFHNGFEMECNLIQLLKNLIRYVYHIGSTTTVKFEIYNIIKHIMHNEAIDDYITMNDIDDKLNYHPRLRKGFALLVYYLQEGKVLSDYSYDKILSYKDVETTFSGLFKDKQSMINCVESLGNDIILDRPKKYLGWDEKKNYYSASGITEVSEVTAVTDIVSLIEKRTLAANEVLGKFFFK